MARPQKLTVDYFPHYANASEKKTLYILETKYGIAGFAFWFKLLELLASTPGHYFRYDNPAEWEFLTAKTKVSDDLGRQILAELALLGAIDEDLYKKQCIWSSNFVEGLSEVYRRRQIDLPQKPSFNKHKPLTGCVSDDINCIICGKIIEDKRSGSQYCSNECRQSAYRKRQGVTDKKYKCNTQDDIIVVNDDINPSPAIVSGDINPTLSGVTVRQKPTEVLEVLEVLEGPEEIKEVNIPDFIDKDLWGAFLEMRRKIKKPTTDTAEELLLKKLMKFKLAGDDPNEILERSITASWQGLFPLDRRGKYGEHREHTETTDAERKRAADKSQPLG